MRMLHSCRTHAHAVQLPHACACCTALTDCDARLQAKAAGKAVKHITWLGQNGSIHDTDASMPHSNRPRGTDLLLPTKGSDRPERIHTGLSMIQPSDGL